MIAAMMDWLVTYGGTLVLVMFFAMFLGFSFWAYRPSNKQKIESYGTLLFKEQADGNE